MNDLTLPAAFQGVAPAKAFQDLDAQGDSLSAGIGTSYGVIHYRGKVWSLTLRGENHMFVREDGSPLNHIDVVILNQAEVKSKSYYPKKDGNDFTAGERPLCSSLNGITPDANVPQQQAETCALCPRNQSKPTGKDGKMRRECSDYKRLAVFILPSLTAPLFKGVALAEPVFLRVPAASLNSLSQMGAIMGPRGFHYSSYVTRIAFDVTKAHPQMMFSAVHKVPDGPEADAIMTLRNEPQTLRIIAADNEQLAIGAAPANAALAPPPQSTGFAAALKQEPQVIPPASQPAPVAMKTINPTVAAKPVEERKSVVEEADADLEAQIDALMPNL